MAYLGKPELRPFADWLAGQIGDVPHNEIERRAARRDIKLLPQSLGRWRGGFEFPRPEGVQRLSDYFGVSVVEIEAMRPRAVSDGKAAPSTTDIGAVARELAELRALVESNVVPGRIAPSAREHRIRMGEDGGTLSPRTPIPSRSRLGRRGCVDDAPSP